MGFLTNKAKVWYPAVTDKMQLHTLFATLASSIENGLEPRVAKQEITKAASAHVASGTSLPMNSGTFYKLPISIVSGTSFNNGMSLTNSIWTIEQPGLYFFATNCVVNLSSGYSEIQLYKNSTMLGQSLANSGGSASPFAMPQISSMMSCVAGDTVQVKVGLFGTAGSLNAGSVTYNAMSAVLVKAF